MGKTHRKLSNRGAELFSVLFLLLLVALCGTVLFGAGLVDMQNTTYAPNVTINEIDVGGRTLSEVRELFRDKENFGAKTLTVVIDEDSWSIDLTAIDAGYNVIATEDAAFALGHTGGVLQRLGDVLALRAEPRHFSFEIDFNEDKLRDQVDAIYAQVSVQAQDAEIEFRPDSKDIFAITNEINGKTIDKDALLQTLEEKIRSAKLDTVQLSSTPLPAGITGQTLEESTELVATYTTSLTDDEDRNHNIVLASESVNGTVVQPGDTFSFNDTTGERSSANGYVEAPTIANSQLVDAPGGGVCQVSSTLYNAALLAGMTVMERHHHTWPMSYVPAGLDATVDFGRKDLRLKNDTDMPVYVVVKVNAKKGTVTASLYGRPPAATIEVTAEEVERLEPDDTIVVENRHRSVSYRKVLIRERDGVRTKTYRTFTANGEEARRELVSEDYYPPVQGKIEVGTIKTGSDGNK